ncbi:kinase-like domain-containing protein [Lipomyces oligophaga]|uniref:kinase-like domain-containing protein n=1 Tax=Lipomyces oligophaga TaxID=45792 RepID=UPI0034CDAC8F
MATYVLDLVYTLTSCVSCFPSPTLYINNRSYKIQRLLGEGGFSYVYLVQAQNGELFALKKIRCPFGAESLSVAMKEIESYRLFNDERIIHIVDSNVVQERDGSRTVYILLPYFRNGNLQDTVNSNLINGSYYSERDALDLFLEIARGLRVMHLHSELPAGKSRSSTVLEGDHEANQPLILGESRSSTPLVNQSSESDTFAPYAHRDIKPANIMLSQTGVPVLMDLGSCMRARTKVTSRAQALEIQDSAAEQCTLPYRAPELFDVKTNTTIDERVDIWSLGCTFFCLLYSSSPFELQTSESGASLNLAIANGQYRFPESPRYSEVTKNIIRSCLTVDPATRPFVDDIISQIEGALSQLS